MRRDFHPVLLEHMRRDPRIHLISADLGYGMWDAIARELPDQFYQFSATEQLAVGAAVGMAHDGLIPVVYSITPFLLYRPAEFIRNYLNHEGAAVKLLGGGRGQEYSHDGFTHDASDDHSILSIFPNIATFWPETTEDMKRDTMRWLWNGKPSYLNLKR